MKKLLIAIMVCGSMGIVMGWYVADAIKKRWPAEEWKEVEVKKAKAYEVKGKWNKGVLELTR